MVEFLKKARVPLAACLFLFWLLTGPCFAAEEDEGGPVILGDTEVWAGVMVEDYLVTLRYLVTDQEDKPLKGVAIEHYDHNEKEYIYVGTTGGDGIWESQVSMDYWTDGIIGKNENVTVVESGDYWGNLLHRLTQKGYVTVEGEAKVEVSRSQDGVLGLVRVQMEKVEDEPEDKPEDEITPGASEDHKKPQRPTRPDKEEKPSTPSQTKPPRPGENLPGTGVGSIASYLIVGCLLLLLAAAILFKILREERKRVRSERESNGRDD